MSRAFFLWSLLALQGICCAYFLADLLGDAFWPALANRTAESDLLEGLVTIALFLGLAFTASELLRVLNRQSRLEDQIKVASGAFTEVLEARFREWSLTTAERDIAILSLKGFSIAEMADLRETKEGTIKAQCASLYRKADVGGRLQLIGLFLEDLLADDLIGSANPPGLG